MASVRRVLGLASTAAMVATALLFACGTYNAPQQYSNSDFGTLPDGATSNPGVDSGDATLILSNGGYSGPTTCAQAAMTRSYVGCDYWPTVTTNPVWSIFDFAVVVANAQSRRSRSR